MSSYEQLGVSPTKEDVHAAIADMDPGLYPGAFCMLMPDTLTNDPDKCLLMHADGAGTKSSAAYIYWKETGDASVFRGIAQDSIVMNTDDALCVGITNNLIVSNTIGRNAHRIDGEVLSEIIHGYVDFSRRMQAAGVFITLAGGETADLGDLTPTVVVDSTLTALAERSTIIDASRIKPGNAIVGLASFGQASYESAQNSGIGSNGFTRARHALLDHGYAHKYPETFSSTLNENDVYQGPYQLGDTLPESDMSVGEALLSPTRTYLPVMDAVLSELRPGVTGIIHCSGGGQTKVLKFGSGLHVVKDNLFEPPPVFRAIEESGGVSRREMYKVFNMGHRLEVYCNPEAADEIVAIARAYSVGARVVGHVEATTTDGNKLTIRDESREYEYAHA